ncbi:MAG TPA: response regulator [Microlunatus sp.]|jgi:CheY-like chemotaxis protein|nr:response regulator [Microlunatus sp.]
MSNAEVLSRSAATVDDRAVLLVEDNFLNQMVADGMLRLLGYTARCVVNGLEALEELQSLTYPIVLMDVHMPELDGFETTRRIRAEMPIDRQPYIIAVTANAMPGDADRCRAAGMDDYVSKPLSKEALRAALLRARRRVES